MDNLGILKNIVRLHFTTKKYLIMAEELGERTLIQPIKEFRDAYDHILQTFFCKDKVVVNKELEAAYSHEYRAFIDTLDLFCINVKNKIYEEIQRLNGVNIKSLYPNYGKMRNYILTSIQKITAIRANRNEWNHDEAIKEYGEIADNLYAYYQEFIQVLGE